MLQALDQSLFRLINQTFANPVCDWLMPRLSDKINLIPLALVAGIWLLWKGGARGRVCALMLALAVPVSDGLVTANLKKFIGRPRPFVSLDEVRMVSTRDDTGNWAVRTNSLTNVRPREARGGAYESMPSGHSSNMFSLAMVAFLFYRRSAWLMVPLAVGVALSRIYNGVHYPLDTLGGALVGCGSSIALVTGLDWLWRRVGARWFPLWWQRLPSLWNPDLPAVVLPEAARRRVSPDAHWLHLGQALIGVMLVFKLWYVAAGPLELSEDEAYQWVWAKHLDWSYYSKPPLIAWSRALALAVFGNTEFAVRCWSPVLAAVISLATLRFVAREVNARVGFVMLLVSWTTPLVAVGSTLFTVDPLLVSAWTAALISGWRAVQPSGSTRHWVWTGVWLALGFLSKYTALFLWLCWALFFLTWPPARVHLRRPGPWLALLINGLATLPVVLWNAQRDWITVKHVATNANLDEAWEPRLRYFLDFTGASAGLLNPVYFIAALWAAIAFWPRRHRHPLHLYLFCMGMPVFLIYLLYTIRARVLPNWIAPAVLPMLMLMVLHWHERWREDHGTIRRRLRGALGAGLGLGLVAVVLMYAGAVITPRVWPSLASLVKRLNGRDLTTRSDPFRRLTGWEAMARAIETERRKLEAGGPGVFLIGGHYGVTSLQAFYSPAAHAGIGSTNSLIFHLRQLRPRNQYFFWPGYRDAPHLKGRDALYFSEGNDDRIPPILLEDFASVTPLPVIEVRERGRVLHPMRVLVCRGLR